jgi:hypothetical protein
LFLFFAEQNRGGKSSPNPSKKVGAHDSKKFGKISSDILLLKSVLSYLEEKASHQINLRRLRAEAHHLMEICFWANSHHWSSYPSKRKKSEPNTIVRVAYFKNLNWFAFSFSKFHPCGVEVLQLIPDHERFFYEKTHDRYTKFRAWCIAAKHFERVLTQLQQITDIELEFVVHPSRHGLVIPEPFKGMGLTFIERGKTC